MFAIQIRVNYLGSDSNLIVITFFSDISESKVIQLLEKIIATSSKQKSKQTIFFLFRITWLQITPYNSYHDNVKK